MKTINIKVPRGWHELDDTQLRYLFGMLADENSSAENFRVLLLLCLPHNLKVDEKKFCIKLGKSKLFS